jgi:hypothetical protein
MSSGRTETVISKGAEDIEELNGSSIQCHCDPAGAGEGSRELWTDPGDGNKTEMFRFAQHGSSTDYSAYVEAAH